MDNDYCLTFVFQSDEAIRVHDTGNYFWLPKSLISIEGKMFKELKEGEEITVTIPDWLASQKNLI
jgi:hypothetical protein